MSTKLSWLQESGKTETVILVTAMGVLSLLGLLFIFEASIAEALNTFNDQYHFVKLQGGWLGLGLVGVVVVTLLPRNWWWTVAPWLYGAGLVVMGLVFVPGLGVELNGARRWLSIGGLAVLQPVELLKLTMILFFGRWMAEHQRLAPLVFLTGMPVLLLLLQPDLGSALVVLVISAGMYFSAGGNTRALATLAVIGAVLVSGAVLSSSYRLERVMTFLNPSRDPQGASFHIRQITIALGRGGLFGQGIGNSQQRFAYIPETSTDSIFAITAEEIGFAGSVVIISLYSAYLWAGYALVNKVSDHFARLVSIGVLIWIGSQTWLNLAAVVALVPLTGIPLPFFSYGGSSLVMVLLATGILLNMTRART
ncbi:MAG: stage V sporulation protein E [Candidatus Pacebacteria bacterium CG10_big_fil_rev_8_21_14_0_10_56_10]|nr:MAG: stage V sporulation protein E [Candidatus Pacebacteria bacterium CG10_big_fil_rev_8_21_14_0_10_56_10]